MLYDESVGMPKVSEHMKPSPFAVFEVSENGGVANAVLKRGAHQGKRT